MAWSEEKRKEENAKAHQRRKDERAAVNKAAEQDASGKRHKSEVLSQADLLKLYYGMAGNDLEVEDKKKAKKSSIRPSVSKILGEERSFEEWLEMRDQARKDLFWLGRDVLKKDLVEKTHRIVCEQFVQKNFDGAYHEGYTIGDVHKAIDRQQRFDDKGNATKEMLLLDPRGFFKSTIDGIDCIQWMLNAPDIRILILTGEYKLAAAFMKEIKAYMFFADGADPTDFHLLFPEYVLTGVSGSSKEPIECPARRHDQKEATLWVNSIDSNLSGWHCDIKKGDDVITDENSNTEAAREKLKDKFDGTDNLLDEWGFSDNIGTRYFAGDWYGTRLEPADPDDFVPLKYFVRKCWEVKPGSEDVPLKKLTEDMVVLNFPEKATFTSLRKKLLKSERSFRNQQLNEPSEDDQSEFKVTFSEDLLRTRIMHASAAPKEGDLYVVWDWAPSAGKYSDMSVGVAGRIVKSQDGRFGIVVLEVLFDRWKPSELAFHIVAFNKKWVPKKTLIEKSPGAELLQMEISRQAVKYGTSIDVYWKPVTLQADAKRNRIKGLETLLQDNLLSFVGGTWIDETFRQLVNYTGERKNKGRKDDIPDAISFLCFFLPSTTTNEDYEALQLAAEKAATRKREYERMFGGQQTVRQSDPVAPVKSEDPRNRIFGGNGLHI